MLKLKCRPIGDNFHQLVTMDGPELLSITWRKARLYHKKLKEVPLEIKQISLHSKRHFLSSTLDCVQSAISSRDIDPWIECVATVNQIRPIKCLKKSSDQLKAWKNPSSHFASVYSYGARFTHTPTALLMKMMINCYFSIHERTYVPTNEPPKAVRKSFPLGSLIKGEIFSSVTWLRQ